DVCVLYASSTDFYSLSLHDALPICFYGVNSLRPGQGGAEPDLQFRCEFSAFIQAAHPQAIISGMIGIRDEQLRTAIGAEHLRPASAAAADLHIGLGFALKNIQCAIHRLNIHPVGGRRQFLAIRAVANRSGSRVNIGFETDLFAMAAAMYFHVSLLKWENLSIILVVPGRMSSHGERRKLL